MMLTRVCLQLLPYVMTSSLDPIIHIQYKEPFGNEGARRSAWEVPAVVCLLHLGDGQATAGADPMRSEPVKRT